MTIARPAINASLGYPFGIAVDQAGNLYIADGGIAAGNRIRKVDTTGIITTVAGNGQSGFGGDCGPATGANLGGLIGVAVDRSGNLYIADNGRIRKVSVNDEANPTPTVYNFPVTPVLDNFNHPDGALGSNWSGSSGTAAYRIVGQQVEVHNGGPIYSQPVCYGVNQEAFVLLAAIDPTGVDQDLLLKVQGSNGNYRKGAIDVHYAATDKVKGVKVKTKREGATWKIYSKIPVTFQNGDQLGARVYATGKVEVYRNQALVGSIILNRADQKFFNGKGGRIGLRFRARNALFDDFGGGNFTP